MFLFKKLNYTYNQCINLTFFFDKIKIQIKKLFFKKNKSIFIYLILKNNILQKQKIKMDSKKLNYIERPYIMGQSNFAPYRPLALFYPICKLAEMIFEVPQRLKELSKPIIPTLVAVPKLAYNFQEIEYFLLKYLPKELLRDKLSHYFSFQVSTKITALRYGYVLFDIFYRNKKFNKEKTKSYKFMYTLDLALWHSLATFIFPIYSAKASFAVFRNLSLIPKNRNIYWNFFSIIAGLNAFVNFIKFGDFTTDFMMNNTYRRFVYDYKIEENNQFTLEYDKLMELDNSRL